jgi:hypothetical protein
MIEILQKGVRYSSRLMRHFVWEAKLHASRRLPQHPPYLSYWYDPCIHALVGLHVALDLHRHDGRYHVIETNLGPDLYPKRRALYDTLLDPVISALVAAAKSRGFQRLVFQQWEWSKSYLDEFQIASRQSGLEVLGLNATSLPKGLSANTMYVVCSSPPSPLCHFVHDKYWSAKWLKETIDAEADRMKLLTYVPTFDHLVLQEESCNPGLPNIVIKLSGVDRGKAILFGRFRSRQHARRALRSLRFSSGPFTMKWHHQLFHRTIYQPFIPPEVLNNRPRRIRIQSFVSPIFDAFLSAHATVGVELPNQIAEGLVEGSNPFMFYSHLGTGAYARIDSVDEEEELRLVNEEFGRVTNLAINRKFQTAPARGTMVN